jgi:transposase InsO family protein
VKYAFIERQSGSFPVQLLCRVLKVSKSGFYDWRGRAPSLRCARNAALVTQIRAVHAEHRQAYGAVKTWHTLNARGTACGKHRVARLRRENGIYAWRRSAFRPLAGMPRRAIAAPDLVRRRFWVGAPDRVWVGDMTFVRTVLGWLHVAVVLDLFSRKVIGWAMGEAANEALARNALDMAIAQRNPAGGLIHHTDQGTAYTASGYRSRMAERGILASNSGAGACYDNAVAESFFSTMKNELVHQSRFRDPGEARMALFDYIEVFYNRKRIHQSLGYRTPEPLELQYASTCP